MLLIPPFPLWLSFVIAFPRAILWSPFPGSRFPFYPGFMPGFLFLVHRGFEVRWKPLQNRHL